MDRKEAIEVTETEIIDYRIWSAGTSQSAKQMMDAIKVLLSTAKLVEKVVGKLTNDIVNLKRHLSPDDVTYIVELRILEYVLTLLTEGE